MSEAEPPDMTDQRFAQNLRAAREHAGLSQAALAAEMVASGYPFHQQTIARIEGGTQRVRLAEALALARSVRTSLDALARPAGLARDAYRILDAARRVRAARRDLASATGRLAAESADLERLLERVQKEGHGEALADELAIGRYALSDDEPGYGTGPVEGRT
jgi:transcriptional regulator with XRE-family HTH domain